MKRTIHFLLLLALCCLAVNSGSKEAQAQPGITVTPGGGATDQPTGPYGGGRNQFNSLGRWR